MSLLQSGNVSAPSSSLLRFLRFQTENICFFTPNAPNSIPCLHPLARYSRQRSVHPKRASRYFSTGPKCQATIESSMLNLDFLHSRPIKDSFLFPTFRKSVRPGVVISHKTQDRVRAYRRVSSDARPLLARLWPLKGRRPDTALKPDDLPPLPGFLEDVGGTTLGRSAGKVSNELKLRCTEFDENGKITLVNGEFKKSELIAKVRRIWVL